MHRSVDRVVLEGRNNVETRLLKPQREATRPGEEIDGDRTTAGDQGSITGAPSNARTYGSHATILRWRDDGGLSGYGFPGSEAVFSPRWRTPGRQSSGAGSWPRSGARTRAPRSPFAERC